MENESDLAYAGERPTARGSYDVLLDPVHGAAMPQGHTVYFIPDDLVGFDDPEPESPADESVAEAVDDPPAVPDPVVPEPVVPDPVVSAAPVVEDLPAWMLTTAWTPPAPALDAYVPDVGVPDEPVPDAYEPEPVAPEAYVPAPVEPEPEPAPDAFNPSSPEPEPLEVAAPVDRPRRTSHRKPDPEPEPEPEAEPLAPEPVCAQPLPVWDPVVPDQADSIVAQPDTAPPGRSKHARPAGSSSRPSARTVRIAAAGVVLLAVVGGVFLLTRSSDEPEATVARAIAYSDGTTTTTVPTVPVPLSNPDLNGSIVYTDGTTLVLMQAGRNEMTVETDAATQVVGGDETVANLDVGQNVTVQGTRTRAGTYLAQTITVQ